MKRATWLVAGAVLLSAAACGDNAGRGEDVAWEANQFEDTLPPLPDTAAALTVMMTEWNMRLAADTIRVGDGPVRIRARNMGGYPHAVAISGPGGPWRSNVVGPDEWTTVDADLQPGTYTVYCPVEGEQGNHRAQGMESYLVVLPEEQEAER